MIDQLSHSFSSAFASTLRDMNLSIIDKEELASTDETPGDLCKTGVCMGGWTITARKAPIAGITEGPINLHISAINVIV